MTIRQHFVAVAFILCILPAAVFADDAAAPQGNIPDAYSSILQRGVLGGEGSPSFAPQAAPVSSPYRLIGILQSGGFSGAVLEDGTGVQTFYRVDQRLPDDSRIVRVKHNSVLIRLSDGSVSELVVIDDVKAPAVSSNPNVGPPAATPAAEAAATSNGQKAEPRSPRRRRSAADE